MRFLPLLACIALAAPLPAAALSEAPAPTKPVEVSRYTGRWYEIARIPNKLEEDCQGPTADYAVDEDKVTVVQTCRRGSPTGPERVYHGAGRILDPGRNTKLRLTFFAIISKEYWVLDHAADYGWAVIGDPSGKYLWLMARAAIPPPAERKAMIAAAGALGYDVARLEYPSQATQHARNDDGVSRGRPG
jgi:apolipoprotein D and lipocalin family protein